MPGAGIGLVRLDEAREHVEEERPLLWRKGGEDALLLGACLRPQVVMNGLALRAQAQHPGAPVPGLDAPVEVTERLEPVGEVVRRDRIHAEAQREGALVDVGGVVQRCEDGELDRRQPGRLGDFGGEADADLLEPPRQMRRDAMARRNDGSFLAGA